MLEPHVRLLRQHNGGGAGQSREPRQGFAQCSLDRCRPTDGLELTFDRLALRLGQIADLHQRIDEKAQSQFCRQPARGGVRRVDQSQLLKIRHHVAHRGRRQRHRDKARDVARAYRLAGGQIALDDLAEDIPRPLVELRQSGVRRDQMAYRVVVGQNRAPNGLFLLQLSIARRADKRHSANILIGPSSSLAAAGPTP